MLFRPEVTDELVAEINAFIKQYPEYNRLRIYQELCERWDWRDPYGRPKYISCGDMLRLLDKKGAIKLPEPKFVTIRKGGGKKPKHLSHDMTLITGGLRSFMPLTVERVESKAARMVFKSYIDQFHYLGFDRTVGENMGYMVRDKNGSTVALLLYGSAAWTCGDRDDHIGWTSEQRKNHLQMITNNTRFLIPQWVRVPYLASHVLSLIAKRISADWQVKYGHPILCLETFVDEQFEGTVYRAANWIYVGKTKGRGRDDTKHLAALTVKSAFLYPLVKNYRELLCSETNLLK